MQHNADNTLCLKIQRYVKFYRLCIKNEPYLECANRASRDQCYNAGGGFCKIKV